MGYTLTLFADTLTAGATLTLAPLSRVLFALDGDAEVGKRGDTRLARASAWHGAGECAVQAGTSGVRLLRFELGKDAPPIPSPPSTLLLSHPIDVDARAAHLMRCDRVDFAPGGVALPHRHRGGGIRYLLRGQIEVTVGDAAPRTITPGSAWFESGREPVLAKTALDAETSFVRVSILPAEIKGQSSILYVDPADAARGKPRHYTVFIDEPITDEPITL